MTPFPSLIDAYSFARTLNTRKPFSAIVTDRRMTFYRPRFSRSWCASYSEFWHYIESRIRGAA